jgi:hypothetical protein
VSRFPMLALGFVVFLVGNARADDSIPAETVDLVKKATVFIKVDGDDWGISGSGFAISSENGNVLVATNNHVAAPSPRPSLKSSGKAGTISVVFDSGTRTERSYKATLVGGDEERDLALLRVTGVKDPPRPIPYTDQVKLIETMTVYSFGFPFGQALSSNKNSPTVTVGKASISALRNGPDGELSIVQIDGSLNPGNSGGPVVDTKGRLVGIAVATIRDAQGIGLTIPAPELVRMVNGRIGRVRVTCKKKEDGSATVCLSADMLDPMSAFRSATAYYVVVPPKQKRPETESLDKHSESKKIALKIEKSVGSAEFTIPAAEGDVLIQVIAESSGKSVVINRVRSYSVASLTRQTAFKGPPLAGWKEFIPGDKSYVVWIPEKPLSHNWQGRTQNRDGLRVRVHHMKCTAPSGLVCEVEMISFLSEGGQMPRNEIEEIIKKGITEAMKGRVTETQEVEQDQLSGTEYTIKADGTVSRVRVFVTGMRVCVVQVTGSSDQVSAEEADTYLSSYRLNGSNVVAGKKPDDPSPGAGPPGVAPGKGPKSPSAKMPVILGGDQDAEFKDIAPSGGFLIGFEIEVESIFDNNVIRGVKPVYLVGTKEVAGSAHGSLSKDAVKVKAKAGYAVGAIEVRSESTFDGMVVIFMKVVDGKLDPKDSYKSEPIGANSGKPAVTIGGDGTPSIGIIGRMKGKDMTGMGLLLKGQEDYEPRGKR